MATQANLTVQDNTRGIPAAHFIEDVNGYLTVNSVEPDVLLKSMQSLYGKYKFMENQLISQQRSLLDKIPEIKAALESVTYLNTQQELDNKINLRFELADSLYASAEVSSSTGTVLLWLGANVMLEYSYEEAITLLTTNQTNAKQTLESLEKDLAFLKDQITVSEVNIARVHNYNVQRKQQLTTK